MPNQRGRANFLDRIIGVATLGDLTDLGWMNDNRFRFQIFSLLRYGYYIEYFSMNTRKE